MPDGEVVFEIKADAKDADKALDQFVKQAKAAGMDIDKAMESAAKSAGDSFQDMGKSFSHAFDIERVKNFAISAVKQIANFAKEAVNAASDLEEVQNVVDVTFGDNAGQINSWAQAAGKAFGLTETKAKQFTSTLGAMMKSAGVSDNEIVKMSTDLAGLTADMASFYNLDFDTAFQKIRSGLSGETEPLRQLGVNLSVANLEAFRLAQGLDKSYSSMSQGEQVVLRYQYLMQATADAQGDFARTSDGYANSLRLLETNIETLKTRLGTALIPIVSNFVAGINDMLEAMQGDLPEETILDKFAAINIKTADKIAEIEKTADSARATAEILDQITGKTYATESLVTTVATFSASIGVLDDAMTTAKNGDYGGTMQAVADALSKSSDLSADDWETILTGTAKAVNEFDADSSKVSWPLALARKAIEAEPSKIGLEGAKDKIDTAISDIAGINTGEAEKTISTIDDVIKEEPSVGIAPAAPQIKDAVADIVEIDTTEAETKVHEIVDVIETQAGDPPLADAVGKVKEAAETKIDTGNLKDTVGEISTYITTAPPEQKDTVIKVLEGIPAAVQGASDAVSENGADVVSFLETASNVANSLGEDKAAAWQAFVDSVGSEAVSGMLEAWAGASAATSNMAAASNALGGFSDVEGLDVVVGNLEAMGIQVSSQEEALAIWQELLGSVTAAIPSLGAAINDTNSDLNIGKRTLKDYIDEWERYSTLQAELAGVREKRQVYESDTSVQDANKEVAKAQYELRAAINEFEKFGVDYQSTLNSATAKMITADMQGVGAQLSEAEQSAYNLAQAYLQLAQSQEWATTAADAYAEAGRLLDEVEASVTEDINSEASALGFLTTEQEAAAKAALESMAPALAQMAEMYESTRESIRNSVENMFDGFEFKMPELDKDAPTASGMMDSLQDQIDYIDEYIELLEEARENGLSADLLGSLSSGSTEDFAYLQALSDAPEKIDQINAKYEEAKQKREEFVDSLTATTLEGDDEWNQLQSQVNEALGNLNSALSDTTAVTEAENIVSGILNALKKCTTDMSSEIDAIIAQWARLEGVGLRGFSPNSGAGGADNGQPHAGGLDYVPFNGYLARLHEGESVLTREQSREWRSYSQGAQNASALDYAALGGVIRDNAPKAGGNVYLDGSAVGRVISDRQADSYRMLERSGWQG